VKVHAISEAPDSISAAEAYLRALFARGIGCMFINAGTDFASIVEAYARTGGSGLPVSIIVPHENTAAAMAHGYFAASGQMAAVMVHVGVGTANTTNGIFNAARQNVPILFTAGRNPIHESGPLGARNNIIHWAQEMFDQGGMVRELVKWDYELRSPEQIGPVVDRAMAIALSEPQGPVYLSLPREVLAAPAMEAVPENAKFSAYARPSPNADAIEKATKLLSQASRPLIITSASGANLHSVAALGRLAEALGAPVVQHRPTHMCLSARHPCHAGFDPHPLLAEADAILVLDCDVPWIPARATPSDDCKVVQIGPDPLFSNYPIRSFPAEIAIAGDTLEAMDMLADRFEARSPETSDKRRAWLEEAISMDRARCSNAKAKDEARDVITPEYASACIGEIIDRDTVLVNEYSLVLEHCPMTEPGSYFSHSSAGGLGWGLGAALGIKLADRTKRVLCVVGDGAYMFGNPTPAHFVARAYELPTLTIVFNNKMWGAVQRATLSMYPNGAASQAESPPLSCLEPSPNYEKIVEASDGYGERVTRRTDLPGALARALAALAEGKQALLNIETSRPGG